ncbi:hypothetical protein [Microbacterium sp. USTB-Y]|uniref:hypothetical protein n=1 Tax=Microbacterium sp. USTB-Y TaxID=2823692 RepID=UPI002040E78C|nr:hypothetical protein [Microbacterium sp. USTB-Y]
MSGISGPLESALGTTANASREPIAQAAADLERNGLAQIPLTTTMTPQGIFAARTNAKGHRFLEFLNEPDSVAAHPPTSL